VSLFAHTSCEVDSNGIMTVSGASREFFVFLGVENLIEFLVVSILTTNGIGLILDRIGRDRRL